MAGRKPKAGVSLSSSERSRRKRALDSIKKMVVKGEIACPTGNPEDLMPILGYAPNGDLIEEPELIIDEVILNIEKPMVTEYQSRRDRTDSHSAIVNAFKNKDIIRDPPSCVKMTNDALQFWPSIMRGRAFNDWNQFDLIQAAMLAMKQAMLAREMYLLDNEGAVVMGADGMPRKNPRSDVIKSLTTSISALCRQIGLCVTGDSASRKYKNGRDLEASARDITADSDDVLLS